MTQRNPIIEAATVAPKYPLPPQQQQSHVHIDLREHLEPGSSDLCGILVDAAELQHMRQAQQAEPPLFNGPIDWGALMGIAKTDYEQIMTLHNFDAAWHSDHPEVFPDNCPPEQVQDILCKSAAWVRQSRSILNDSRLVEGIRKGWVKGAGRAYRLSQMEEPDRTEAIQSLQAGDDQPFLRAMVALQASESRRVQAEQIIQKQRTVKETREVQGALGIAVQMAKQESLKHMEPVVLDCGILTVQVPHDAPARTGTNFKFGLEIEIDTNHPDFKNPYKLGFKIWEQIFAWAEKFRANQPCGGGGCRCKDGEKCEERPAPAKSFSVSEFLFERLERSGLLKDGSVEPKPLTRLCHKCKRWVLPCQGKETELVTCGRSYPAFVCLDCDKVIDPPAEEVPKSGTCSKCGHEIKERQLLSGSYVGCMC